ncbi:hypothetical protein NZK35_08955 [Stieleria sp. ICT_E10.1]|nr:hypothetical protein [Stieleria sedimenti]
MRDAKINIREQGYELSPVAIEDDVWIAARSVILPGVRLARGTVVAAGSVVTKSSEPNAIIAGTPAKVIGKRESGSEIIHQQSDSD